VSRRIREEYENGREYYAWHGKTLSQLPDHRDDAPGMEFLTWHQSHVYKG
jgi:putative restriction endonuclease